MRIPIFGKKPFFLVTILVFFGAALQVQAAPSFLGRKTKVATCEVMLNNNLKAFTTPGSPLPSLRELKFRLQKQISDRSNDDMSYEDSFYSGSIESIRIKKAQALIERLNGIEGTIMSTNLDRQILSYEFRGAEIEKALKYLEVKEAELEPIYQKTYEKEWSRASRLASKVIGVTLAWTMLDISHDMIHSIEQMTSESLRHAFFIMVFIGNFAHDILIPSLKHNKERLDSDYFKLKKFLKNADRDKNDIFVSGSSIKIPTEFHHMLMSKENIDDPQARQIAIRQYGGSFLEQMFGRFFKGTQDHTDLLQRHVANAGDLERSVFLDHLVYFDEETNEPVWMFFYRSFQNRPQGNKTKKTKSDAKESERDWQWLPGLSPVPAHN